MTAAAGDSGLAAYARQVLAAAGDLPGDGLVERHYALPFAAIEARFSDPAYAEYCDGTLVTADDASDGADPYRLLVTDRARLPVTAPAGYRAVFDGQLQLDRALAADGLRGSYFHDDRLWHFYDAVHRQGVELMQASGAHPPWENSAPLRPFLHWIYAETGRRIVHAATLGNGGRGILLAGKGGAGKSGTTVAGVLAGLDTVGDDYVLIDPAGPPMAYPLYRVAKQDDAGYRRLGLARALPDPGPLNWQGKYEFDLGALGAGRLVPRLDITALVLPRLAGAARSAFTAIGGREAMLALAPSGIFQMPGNWESAPRFFADIVRALPCYRLELGSDPAEIADAIGGFIAGRRP